MNIIQVRNKKLVDNKKLSVGDFVMEECPVKYALDILSGKWIMQIVWELSQEKVIRFNDLQRRVGGISSLMLSKNLHELQEHKLVNRIQYNEIPPRVEYQLTDLGKAIKPALDMLGEWGIRVYNENDKGCGVG
jgi:DNA-binding HxlR family transcriptional regulator